MTHETRLDAAHAAMRAAPEDEGAWLGLYEAVAAVELFVLLKAEAEQHHITPRTVEADGKSHVLAFDSEERLAQFAGDTAPYAALPGRALAVMLAGQGLGLALNLGVAPSEILLPAESLAWLAETLADGPAVEAAQLREFAPPGDLPEALLSALDARLASAAGLADRAYLATARHESGAERHILGIIAAPPAAEAALARAVAEAVRFSGPDPVALDVVFLAPADSVVARLARVGLRFDLPVPESATQIPGAAPGMDPDRPPRLK